MTMFEAANEPNRQPPAPEQLRAWRRRSGRPTNEVPGTVPVDLLLARNEDVAVALGGMHAYSSGLQFDLLVRERRVPPPENAAPPPMRLYEQVAGFRGQAVGPGAFLLGFGYPDGRTATNLGSVFVPRGDIVEGTPLLHPGGGTGDDEAYDGRFWLSPVPTGGDLTIVCAWPARGIPETRAIVAQGLIEEALLRVVELWPPPPEDKLPLPTPLGLPPMRAGSWFATVLGLSAQEGQSPPTA